MNYGDLCEDEDGYLGRYLSEGYGLFILPTDAPLIAEALSTKKKPIKRLASDEALKSFLNIIPKKKTKLPSSMNPSTQEAMEELTALCQEEENSRIRAGYPEGYNPMIKEENELDIWEN